MPNREEREIRRRGRGFILPILIAVCALTAAVLIVMLMRTSESEDMLSPTYTSNSEFKEEARAPLVVMEHAQTALPVVTLEPTMKPVVEEKLEEITVDETLGRLPAAKPFEGFIPVCEDSPLSENDRKMIAVTIDDCGKRDTLYTLAQIAYKHNAKLTLFPYGEAMMKQENAQFLNFCVHKLGYELENHGYNARSELEMSDGELEMQIWKQGIAASYVVGSDYEQHFYRPFNRNSDYDQRIHYYVGQLGLKAIGAFTHSYQNYATGADLAKTLENGKIYQFDMNKKVLDVFEEFLGIANQKGYEMVTLNELFGLEENRISDRLTIDQQEFPQIEVYRPTYYDLKLGYRTAAVVNLQKRLIELGYMHAELKTVTNDTGVSFQRLFEAEPDGIYGQSTSEAVSVFQGKIGVAATGNADVETQKALFSPNAPAYDGETLDIGWN